MTNVIIIDRNNGTGDKHYQILQIILSSPFENLFPSQMFTLEQAEAICKENNYNIKRITHEWNVFSKSFRRSLFD